MKKILIGLMMIVMAIGCSDETSPYSKGKTVYALKNVTVTSIPKFRRGRGVNIVDTLKKNTELFIISDSTNKGKAFIHIQYYDTKNGITKTGFVAVNHVTIKSPYEQELLIAENKRLIEESKHVKNVDDVDGYIPFDVFINEFPLRKRKIVEIAFRLNEPRYMLETGQAGIVTILGSEYLHTDYLHWLDKQ